MGFRQKMCVRLLPTQMTRVSFKVVHSRTDLRWIRRVDKTLECGGNVRRTGHCVIMFILGMG